MVRAADTPERAAGTERAASVLTPGDALYLNSLTALYGRVAFEDSPDAEQRPLPWRLWRQQHPC